MHAFSVPEEDINELLDGRRRLLVTSWLTSHRGELLLCYPMTRRDLYLDDHNATSAVMVNVTNCRQMVPADSAAAAGDTYAGWRYVWELSDIQPVARLQVKGRRFVYELPDELAGSLAAASRPVQRVASPPAAPTPYRAAPTPSLPDIGKPTRRAKATPVSNEPPSLFG